jgi:voltage-gated potassium channel
MAGPSEQERLDNLRRVPLFARLGDEALIQVLGCATEFDAAAGHVLVETHQAGTGLFVIEEGSATVELPGRKVELGPGDFFGELALLRTDEKRQNRVSAASAIKGLAIRRDDFDNLLDKEPTMAIAILKTLAQRVT